MFWRSWVRIQAPYTGLTFFPFICCQNCNVCLKRRKQRKKRPGMAHFYIKMNSHFIEFTYYPHSWNLIMMSKPFVCLRRLSVCISVTRVNQNQTTFSFQMSSHNHRFQIKPKLVQILFLLLNFCCWGSRRGSVVRVVASNTEDSSSNPVTRYYYY